MRPAKTSILYFLSDVGTSVIGFLATLYFARTLGASVLGRYFVVVALVAWLSIPSNGVKSAIIKRMSEGTDQRKYLSAGFVTNGVLAAVIALTTILLRAPLETYLGAPVGIIFVILFVGQVGFWTVSSSLKGQQMVAHAGGLRTLDRILRVGIQVSLVVVGYEVAGLVAGHAVAFFVAAAAGLALSQVEFSLPTREHFRELFSYARYSWLSNMRSRTFGWMDTLVLSLFVGSGLIGIYEISWRLASVLILVSNSVSQTLFPEMSSIATTGDYDEVRKLLGEALFAAGIFTIPGFVGAFVLGPRILRIYGSEFAGGSVVLLLLIAARTLNAYGSQMLNVIDAVDRPDLAFRINLAFVVTNLVLNLTLVYLYGWYGAAIATGVSSLLMLVLGFYTVSKVIGMPPIPVAGVGQQVVAATLMGASVLLLQRALPWQNRYVTVGLVLVGGVVYAAFLLALSSRLRDKVESLVPGPCRRVPPGQE
jgi:O-antigen/teichoic acid export membrane protein